MTASRPVEITGMWSPEEHKKLDWGSATILKTKISDGYSGGDALLDIFVCTSMPWLNSHVIEYVSKGESLSYEYVSMVGSKKKGGKITFEDLHSGEKAQVDKKIFLKLMTDLEKDFQKNSSKSKVVTSEEKHDCQTTSRKRNRAIKDTKEQKRGSASTRRAKRAKIVVHRKPKRRLRRTRTFCNQQ